MTDREKQIRQTLEINRMTKMKENALYDEGEREYNKMIDEKVRLADRKKVTD